MAKKSNDSVITSIYKDAVKVRGLNREIAIVKMEPEVEFGANNVIFFKALTSEVGKDAGVRSTLEANEKLKYSSLGLSDDALMELFMALGHYLKRINNQIE